MKAKTFRPFRRAVLKAMASLGSAAAFTAMPEARAQNPKPKPGLQKRPKEKVGYRDEPYEGRACGKCVLYVGNGECVIVEGTVSPDGWCVQWTPATMGRRSDPTVA